MKKLEESFGCEISSKSGSKRIKLNNRGYYESRLKSLPDGKYTLILTNKKENRSSAQNRYYWVYLHQIEAETGNRAEEIHEYAKRKFLQPKTITVKGETIRIPNSTKDLSKAEMVEYMDFIEGWSGVTRPNPEAVGYITN